MPELNEAEVARIQKARENKPWDVAELLPAVGAIVGACAGSSAGKFVTIFKFCYLWSLLLGFSTLLFIVGYCVDVVRQPVMTKVNRILLVPNGGMLIKAVPLSRASPAGTALRDTRFAAARQRAASSTSSNMGVQIVDEVLAPPEAMSFGRSRPRT